MQNILIRQYNNEDYDIVWNLHMDGLKQSGSLTKDRSWDNDLLDINKAYLNGRGDFILAILNNEIVGIGGLRCVDDLTAEIKRMRVRIENQRKGIGALILNNLIEKAALLGYKRLILDTSDNQQPAKRLYEKYGFKEYKKGKVEHLIITFYERHIQKTV